MVDWDLAVATANRFVRPGPDVSGGQAREVVTELRENARRSEGLVRSFTGLRAQAATAPVMVVDRPGWVQANADGFRTIMQPLVAKIVDQRGTPSPASAAIGSRITGLEAGALLGYLSGKVLGQFDPFWPGDLSAVPGGMPTQPERATESDIAHADPAAGRQIVPTNVGRLLLVAPNIVHVERELGVDPHDFRLWVCLHEETHRVQFTAVSWLRDHLHNEIRALIDATDFDVSRLAAMARDGLEQLGRLMSGDENAPPVLAIVLIRAMPPTAPIPLMNDVESDQNGPIMLIIPIWAIVRASRTSQGERRVALSPQPAAASMAQTARCHRRSPVRSEWRPTITIAIAPAA